MLSAGFLPKHIVCKHSSQRAWLFLE